MSIAFKTGSFAKLFCCLLLFSILYFRYEVTVDIFDVENRKMFPSENLVVHVEFDKAGYFDVSESTKNGTWLSGSPVQSGLVDVVATLVGTRSPSGDMVNLPVPLVARATLEIHELINIQPKLSSKFKHK